MDEMPDIGSLYPNLSEEQRREAGDKLGQYLLLVLRMYERIRSNPKSYARFRRLTGKTGAVSSGARPGSTPLSPDNLPI